MLFNSISYAIFLPIVFMIYWLVPFKFRWLVLLILSYYFYSRWNVKYTGLILLTTIISFSAGILIEKCKKHKKSIFVIAVSLCLGELLAFKYLGFFGEILQSVLNLLKSNYGLSVVHVLLPVGISFFTFQAISYIADVYRGKIKAEGNFGIFASFLSFFPQLVAGPIERTENLLPQMKTEIKFDYYQATYGLKKMAWGYFKKIAIADVLSSYVSKVFNNVYAYKDGTLLLATVCFTIQIYCDFSGYSDIAIGTGKLFGIELMENFKSPYYATSVKEFWDRWHISLSTWFRDYVYIPMGGNRKGKLRSIYNLMITFLLSGLWHGADIKFVLWGGYTWNSTVDRKYIKTMPKDA